MAHVASDAVETTPRPCMDRLTHAILKETSKSLKYYMDVKCRENAFILNTHAPPADSRLLKTKFILGPNKDSKSSSSNSQHRQRSHHTTVTSPEKQMCREELDFHMHSYHFIAKDHPKSTDIHLRPKMRSSSLNVTKRDLRSRSGSKLTRHEKDHLIDHTADILASLVRSRQSALVTTQSDLTDFNTSPINERGRGLLPRVTSSTQKTRAISRGLLCEYRISITTGNCNGASTNAPIRIRLYGTNGHTNFHDLVHSETHYVPFLKDQTDRFILRTYHVGVLAGITIGHDRKDMKASWYLSKVSIDDPIRKVVYEISCNGWLSDKSNDQKTMRDFPVIATIPYEKNSSVNDYEEEVESQSGYSTLSTKSTLSKANSAIGHTQGKRDSQQRHVSIGPTSVAEISPSNDIDQTKTPVTTTTIPIQ